MGNFSYPVTFFLSFQLSFNKRIIVKNGGTQCPKEK
jgi:hypothetical protein